MKIKISELTFLKMSTRPPKAVVDAGYRVICNGDVKCWTGIGWVNEGEATREQYDIIPEVID